MGEATGDFGEPTGDFEPPTDCSGASLLSMAGNGELVGKKGSKAGGHHRGKPHSSEIREAGSSAQRCFEMARDMGVCRG